MMRVKAQESHITIVYGIDKNQRMNKEDDKSLPNMNKECAGTIYCK